LLKLPLEPSIDRRLARLVEGELLLRQNKGGLAAPGTLGHVSSETADATRDTDDAPSRRARPGVLIVFSGAAPTFLALPMTAKGVAIGRDPSDGALLPDERLSRRHATVEYSPAQGWTVRDLGSRNGTFVDGQRLHGSATFPTAPKVIRAADTLLVACPDLTALPTALRDGDIVVGTRLAAALATVARAAQSSPTLLLRGESGTGKENASRHFHALGPNRSGPFVAVNCAAIPEGLAERLLFGARRGAYSGAAADSEGHVQAAHGGVLLLDEGGELGLDVQSKLLRVLETREVVPLGASHGQRVDFRICVATHRDLREAVSEGRFRADLYHRIAPPEVVLPPLRERLDEIAEHVAAEVADVGPSLRPHSKLVEACMLRAWPGNVRELRKEVRYAAVQAQSESADRVRVEHLSPTAGRPFEASAGAGAGEVPPKRKGRAYVRWSEAIGRERIEQALKEHGGNVALAARALGMQRTQMYREMERWSIPRPKRG
jgi:transcriptional regulator of acetoin/glycerol metabolism